MVNCDESQNLLEAYMDGELDAARMLDLEAHISGCETCAAALERLEDLHRVVVNQAPYYNAPPELRKKLESKIAPKRERPWWPMLAIAAGLLLAAGLWRIAPTQLHAGSAAIERDIVAAHVRSLLADHLMDVPSTDRHTVKPWFAGKLDFSPVVEDLSAQGFTLIGGRLDYIDGRTVAALIYRRRQHTINLFTWPTGSGDEKPRSESSQGFHMVHWARGGMAWWAVSDLNQDELTQLPQLLH